MIQRHSGEPNILPFKKAASEAFAFNDVVTKNSSGYLTKATASTPRREIVGLIQKTVASTDDDYASNTMVAVDVPRASDEFEFPVGTGSAVQSMVDKAFDLKDENELDVSVQLTKAVTVRRVYSTTKVIGSFNIDGEKARLVTYQQSVAIGDFTDGGSTAGTLALSCSIPAGAVYQQSLLTTLVGFTGDTSAVIIVGDGSDTDRYSTGTPSVFTTAAAGADLGIPSGTKFHSAAKTPTITITSNADFTAVVAGSFLITLTWLEAD